MTMLGVVQARFPAPEFDNYQVPLIQLENIVADVTPWRILLLALFLVVGAVLFYKYRSGGIDAVWLCVEIMSMPRRHVPEHRGRRDERNIRAVGNSAVVHVAARLRTILWTCFLRRGVSIGSLAGTASLAHTYHTAGFGPRLAADSNSAVAALLRLRGMRPRLSIMLSGAISADFRAEFRHAAGDFERRVHRSRFVYIASILPFRLPVRGIVAFLHIVRRQEAGHYGKGMRELQIVRTGVPERGGAAARTGHIGCGASKRLPPFVHAGGLHSAGPVSGGASRLFRRTRHVVHAS